MKFNLKLDEALFDDELDSFLTKDMPTTINEFDDDFSNYEDESHDVDNVLPGPATGMDTGVAGELISLINDEWEAIQGYNNAIATLRGISKSNPFYEKAIKVLEEISSEENTHVGQLQEVLKQISPNAQEIQNGTTEAKSQLGLLGAPVQRWEDSKTENVNYNDVDETCTITDVDDEM